METAQKEMTIEGEVHSANGVDDKSSTAKNGDTVEKTKKVRPTPESVAMDRGVQNIARKAHNKNKDDKKLIDLLVHVFDNLDSPEKKMEALARKYVQLAAEQKSTDQKLDEFENKHNKMKKERDNLQAEYNKSMIAKGKLESLCRELQKHNKQIKEETQRQAEEEDRKRKELSQKFQSTISDITAQMAENHQRNQQLKQDNLELAEKMKGLVEQYEVREQHIEKVLKAKELELQLCDAKVQQQSLIVKEEMEFHLKEKHVVLEESLIYKKKCEQLLMTETELRSQVAIYTEKFEEFQGTLSKSNEVFVTFKKDMDTMSKTIRKLEKDSNMWKKRWENTNQSLLKMVEDRAQNLDTIASKTTKIEKLEKLCRALQTERQELRSQLQGDNDTSVVSTEPIADVSDSHLDINSQTPLPFEEKKCPSPLPFEEKKCPSELANNDDQTVKTNESDLPQDEKEIVHCDENPQEEQNEIRTEC